eukprot:m.100937 g.100937  ORF g.100937 m.100937 type:complete len:474 (+) comp27290_c0_seq1:97-1518(+)
MKSVTVRKGPVIAVAVAVLFLIYIFSSPNAGTQNPRLSDEGYYNRGITDDKPYDDLVKWLHKSGAEFPHVSGHSRALAGGGRGLFATKEIKVGEPLIKIPAECWISHRSILRASTCAHVLREDEIVKELINEDETWSVVIGLEYERHNPYSPWKEYIHFMRRQESTIWWTEAELKALHSKRIMDDSLSHQKKFLDIYNRVYPHLFEAYPDMFNAEENTLESFKWSALTLWGRAFNVAGEHSTSDVEYGLIPIADLLNHDGGRRSSWFVDYNDPRIPADPTNYVFEANRNTPEGGEIMISYGDKRASYNFMLFCGFIPFGQTYGDFVHIVVRTSDDIDIHVAIGVDGRLDEKFIKELKSNAFDGDRKTTLEYMLAQVTIFLESLPTTYANDLVALNELPSGNYKMWATLTYRTRFKGVYSHLQDNLKSMLADDDHHHTRNVHKIDKHNQAYVSNSYDDRSSHLDYAMDILYLQL